LPFADQSSPGDRAVVQPTAPDLLLAAIELFAQQFKALCSLALKASVGQLLDAVRQARFKEAAVERGRVLVEEVPPYLLEFGGTGGFEGGHAGHNGFSHWGSPWWSGHPVLTLCSVRLSSPSWRSRMRMTAMARMTPAIAAGDGSMGFLCVGRWVWAGMKVHTGPDRALSQAWVSRSTGVESGSEVRLADFCRCVIMQRQNRNRGQR